MTEYSFIAGESGVRLDKYVGDRCPELSRNHAQKLIAESFIKVNGEAAKASLKLNVGNMVDIIIPPAPPSHLSPETIPLHILYEDDDLLVIDKPAGLTVHPAPGHPGHTLVNAILAHYPHLADIGDSLRPGIVHRLDKDTSGVMLVAKNRVAQANLAEQFRTLNASSSLGIITRPPHQTPPAHTTPVWKTSRQLTVWNFWRSVTASVFGLRSRTAESNQETW